jgi:LysR family transcriptional regulator, transcriptional activator of nhaA
MIGPMSAPTDWLNFHHLRYFWLVAREGSVTRAAKRLRVTQPTVSEQIQALEGSLDAKLFRREGRMLALTETGRSVLRHADEIFALGQNLLDSVHGRATSRTKRLTVGVADAVPKVVAYRILEPAFRTGSEVRLVCHEDTPEKLIARLVEGEVDIVISDAASTMTGANVFNHLLGECGVSVFANARLTKKLRPGFPRSLEGAPMLLPTSRAALRRQIDQWLHERGVAPEVIGEFQDAALLSVFAQAGAGVFVAPDAIASETALQHGLRRVGRMKPLRERFYAITLERRIAEPATLAIAGAARETLFKKR